MKKLLVVATLFGAGTLLAEETMLFCDYLNITKDARTGQVVNITVKPQHVDSVVATCVERSDQNSFVNESRWYDAFKTPIEWRH